MALITFEDYPAVRAALDVNLDKTLLPDDTIALDIYHPAAEREVIRRWPTAESETGDDLKNLQAAVVFLTAARLVYAVIQITSLTVQTRDTSYTRPAWDPEKKKAELLEAAEELIATVTEPSGTTPGRPTMFTTAAGTRGR